MKPFSLFCSRIEILTEEIIIAAADYDQFPTDSKLDYISSLELKIQEALK